MARHSRLHVLTCVKELGLVPLFFHPDPAAAQRLAESCVQGGGRLIEFTNRGDRALDVFTRLAAWRDERCPDLILAVGSVVDAATAAAFIGAGADAVVSPLLDADIARTCNARKIAYMPGCGSVSEIHQAHLLGVEICKVFPAGQVGGPAFIKNVKGPCPWAELMPTGGVSPTEENLAAWFQAGAACVGMGSQLISKDICQSVDTAALADKVRQTLALIRKVRA